MKIWPRRAGIEVRNVLKLVPHVAAVTPREIHQVHRRPSGLCHQSLCIAIGYPTHARVWIAAHVSNPCVPTEANGGIQGGYSCPATSVGAEGLPVKNGEHVVLADTAEDFALAVVNLLRNTEVRKNIETAARDFVQKNFSWEKAAAAFRDICWEVVA